MEPALPILRILPTLPILKILPVLPILRMLPTLPILSKLPALKTPRILKTLRILSLLPKLNWLLRLAKLRDEAFTEGLFFPSSVPTSITLFIKITPSYLLFTGYAIPLFHVNPLTSGTED